MLAYPLLTLLLSAALCLLFWTKPRVQQGIAFIALSVLVGLAIALLAEVRKVDYITLQVGGYEAPFGITLIADLTGALMLLIGAIIGFVCFIFGFDDIDEARQARGYYPIYLLVLLGVSGSFLAGDVFNLYVWFEVMLVGSFVLISIGRSKAELEGTIKYVVLNFVASGLFLVGIGVLYKATGTVNMAHVAEVIAASEDRGLITLSSLFFLVCFGIKAALFPFFFWLPPSYPAPPASISGLMAGTLTKVGVYALIRFFTLFFNYDLEFSHELLLLIAGFTMLSGVLGAVAQMEFRKLLSFHIVSQIGYMIMGLALFTPLAVAGALFYIVHNILAKTNLFLVSGMCNDVQGSYHLKKLGGFFKAFPLFALFFAISGFSLAGIPPLSGFWGKFLLAKAGLETGRYLIVVVALVVSLLTLYSMLKVWLNVFWQSDGEKEEARPINALYTQGSFFRKKAFMVVSAATLAALTAAIGLYPSFLVDLSMEAADQLMNPEGYIEAILGREDEG